LDVVTVKKTKKGPKVSTGNWRIVVDEKLMLNFMNFMKNKNGMVEPTCERLSRWNDNGKVIKHLRMDNACENQLLQQCMVESADWKLNIESEYTARDTPQQNYLA
jgi:hypothetical protein